jgi:hypothetical protein
MPGTPGWGCRQEQHQRGGGDLETSEQDSEKEQTEKEPQTKSHGAYQPLHHLASNLPAGPFREFALRHQNDAPLWLRFRVHSAVSPFQERSRLL